MGIYISHIFNAFVENQNYKKKNRHACLANQDC